MLYERVNDHPVLAPQNYTECYEQPIIENPKNEWTWCEYYGTGVPIKGHPLAGKVNLYGCAECKSDNVTVIYAKWCVSTISGDAYWDYEIKCEDCGKFTARSFNEND